MNTHNKVTIKGLNGTFGYLLGIGLGARWPCAMRTIMQMKSKSEMDGHMQTQAAGKWNATLTLTHSTTACTVTRRTK